MSKIITNVELFAALCKMLNCERSGTSEEFATQLNTSARTIRRIIEDLRDRGVDIKFSRQSKKYLLGKGSSIDCYFKINYKDDSPTDEDDNHE